MSVLKKAIDRVVAGLKEKPGHDKKEKELIAYHEAGHALVASFLPNATPVHKVSIIPRGTTWASVFCHRGSLFDDQIGTA